MPSHQRQGNLIVGEVTPEYHLEIEPANDFTDGVNTLRVDGHVYPKVIEGRYAERFNFELSVMNYKFSTARLAYVLAKPYFKSVPASSLSDARVGDSIYYMEIPNPSPTRSFSDVLRSRAVYTVNLKIRIIHIGGNLASWLFIKPNIIKTLYKAFEDNPCHILDVYSNPGQRILRIAA